MLIYGYVLGDCLDCYAHRRTQATVGSTIPGQIVLDYIRKLVKHEMENKLVSNVFCGSYLHVPVLVSPSVTETSKYKPNRHLASPSCSW